MRRYLLDTTPLTAYLFGRPAAVARVDPMASYQAIPSLGRRLSVEEMTQIAAEENAQEVAAEGL